MRWNIVGCIGYVSVRVKFHLTGIPLGFILRPIMISQVSSYPDYFYLLFRVELYFAAICYFEFGNFFQGILMCFAFNDAKPFMVEGVEGDDQLSFCRGAN